MSHFDALKAVRQEFKVSTRLPITHLNTPYCFELESSKIGAIIKFEGIPFETVSDDVINQCNRLLNQAMISLSEEFALLHTLHRHQINLKLEGEFKNNFFRELDKEYFSKFTENNFYANDLYLVLIHVGMSSGAIGSALQFLKSFSDKFLAESRETERVNQIKKLNQALQQLKKTLSDFNPKILGENDEEYSEVLSYFGLIVNGGKMIRYRFPSEAKTISKEIPNKERTIGWTKYPKGHIAPYLPTEQIQFGEYIQFQGPNKKDKRFAAMISIKKYGQTSASVMFDPLLHLPFEFIKTESYAPLSRDLSEKSIEEQRRKLRGAGDKARTETAHLEQLEDRVASGQVTLGAYHHSVMVLADNLSDIEKFVTKVIKSYADIGYVAVRETIGQEPAFFAQIPGNHAYIIRSVPITSENFTNFVPLHNYQRGYYDGNHLGSAVSILETPSKTPMYLNFHVKGEKGLPSKGHVMGFGGNNSGKTVFMTWAASQLSRYNGYIFYFDRDRGADIYIRAAGGHYSRLSPDHPEETCFNPFLLSDTPANRSFIRDLMGLMCMEEEKSSLDAQIFDEIKQCVDYAFEKLDEEHRTLSNATAFLPISFPKWRALRRWLRGNNEYPDGEYAYLFDNAKDNLTLHECMGFDMTHFLDKEPRHVRTPVMSYLIKRIELVVTGERLVSIFLDEAWQYFSDPYWRGVLEKLFPTLRKYNGHFLMFTQSPESVVNSPIGHVLKNNIATEIYFANPQASEETYIDGLKLSESEFSFVKENTPEKRLFLYKQSGESHIFTLNLSHMMDKLPLLSGTIENATRCDHIRSKVGEDPKDWLPHFMKERSRL